MSARPTPAQARAYAEVLIAWSEGKKVEYRSRTLGNSPEWWLFNGEQFVPGFEYRIAPDPPKAREFWVAKRPDRLCCDDKGCRTHSALTHKPSGWADAACKENYIHVREILDTEIVVDKVEYEELRAE